MTKLLQALLHLLSTLTWSSQTQVHCVTSEYLTPLIPPFIPTPHLTPYELIPLLFLFWGTITAQGSSAIKLRSRIASSSTLIDSFGILAFCTIYKVYPSHLVDFRQLIDWDFLYPAIPPLDDPLILITYWLALQLSWAPPTYPDPPTNFGTPRTIETRVHHTWWSQVLNIIK